MSTPLKLGILSTASISETILHSLPPTLKPHALASRTPARAATLAAKFSIPVTCTYTELLDQPVDAVYIPLPTALATDWAVRFARKGFHVLVDKPFDSLQGLQRITTACKESGVIFMDATHFVHSKRIQVVRELMRDLGDVKKIVATYGFPLPLIGNIRSDVTLEPMGALGDLGWYCMRAAVAILGAEVAEKVRSVSCCGGYHERFEGVIESADGVVEFDAPWGRVALGFGVDCRCGAVQRLVVVGSGGSVDVPGFGVPPGQTRIYEGVRAEGEFTTDLEVGVVRSVLGVDGVGNAVEGFPRVEWRVVKDVGQCEGMMREFERLVREGDLGGSERWARESEATQRLVDRAFEAFRAGEG